VVNYYSLKPWNSYYFVPGAEYLNLNSIINVENALVNCCIYYEMKDTGDYYELYAYVTKEDIFEFYDKNQNVKKILLNPFMNNEELFIGYGINNVEQNPFDYINVNMEKFLNVTNNSTDPNLKLSCNEYDINTLDYYLQNVLDFVIEKNYKVYNEYLYKVIEHVSHKIFAIDRIFETHHDIKYQDEVAESYNYLKNKRQFLNGLVNCLTDSRFVYEDSEVFDKSIDIQENNSESNTYNKKEDL
jgi:hypothetical protein